MAGRTVLPITSFIKPEFRGLAGGPPVLVFGTLPAEAEIYAERNGVELVRVLTASRALEHLARVSFRSVAVDPEAEGGIELVRQVKLATNLGDDAAEDAIARNLLTPFVVLPYRGEADYAVIVVPPDISYVEQTHRLRLSSVLYRLDAETLVRAHFRGSN